MTTKTKGGVFKSYKIFWWADKHYCVAMQQQIQQRTQVHHHASLRRRHPKIVYEGNKQGCRKYWFPCGWLWYHQKLLPWYSWNRFRDIRSVDRGRNNNGNNRRLIADNATAAISQDEYARKYNDYSASYEKAKAELEALERKRLRQLSKADSVKRFKEMMIQTGSAPTEYSDDLWNVAVESATVWADEIITFKFKNGQEITEKIYIR